ncbi:unnamed protein product [Cylicocyclus nassatus]|uniref:Uncharacterized protein n=1 Tax=Cylicocyclus nassatus TaxID=53992 RepID=A0AA36LZV4_CYLNA|nr:unnamed protein product [Cylicocyclus nassatus]
MRYSQGQGYKDSTQRDRPLPEYVDVDNLETGYTYPVIQPNNKEQPTSLSFFRNLRKFLLWNTIFLSVLIIGAAIAVILTIVLTARRSPREGSKDEEQTSIAPSTSSLTSTITVYIPHLQHPV